MKLFPNEYIDFLLLIQSLGYNNAVIGGGAVRDTFCNKPVKDVDIFISPLRKPPHKETDLTDPGLKNLSELENVLKLDTSRADRIFYSIKRSENQNHTKSSKSCEGRNNILSVWDVEKNGINFQIIAVPMDPKIYITEYVDFGICMCYNDGKNSFYSPEFFRDYSNKKLTLCGKMNGDEILRSLAYHLPRLQAKFSDYTLSIDPKPLVDNYLNKQ